MPDNDLFDTMQEIVEADGVGVIDSYQVSRWDDNKKFQREKAQRAIERSKFNQQQLKLLAEQAQLEYLQEKVRWVKEMERSERYKAIEPEEPVEEIDHTKIMIGTLMLSIATILMTLGY